MFRQVVVSMAVLFAMMVPCYGGTAADIFAVTPTGCNWYQSSGGSIGLKSQVYSGTDVTAVAAGIIHSSGYDVIVGNSSGPANWYVSNSSDSAMTCVGTVGPTDTANTKAIRNGIAIGDKEKNGIADIFWATNPTGTGSGVFYTTEYAGGNAVGAPSYITEGLLSIAVGDFDGDNYTDVFTSNSQKMNWYEYSPNIGWRAQVWISNVKDMIIGDLDGDSLTDWLGVRPGGEVFWYESNGNNGNPTTVGLAVLTGAQCLTLGDTNGDGHNELLVGTSSGINIYNVIGDNQLSGIMGTIDAGDVRDLAAVTVPEPITMLSLGIGCLLVNARCKRK